MAENLSQLPMKSAYISYWASIIFFILMCIFFIVDIVGKVTILFEYKIYSINTTGILGVISVLTFGWYASIKGRPDASISKHILFSLGFTLITVVLYLGAFTVASLIFSEA